MLLILNNFCITVLFLLLQLLARSAQSSKVHDFSELTSSASRKSRQSSPRINCSDCKQHLTNRIRQMQHLQRMKQRIMSAIRSNGNYVSAVEGSPSSSSPKSSAGDRKRLDSQRSRAVMGLSVTGKLSRNASNSMQGAERVNSVGDKQRMESRQSVRSGPFGNTSDQGQRRVSINGQTKKKDRMRKQKQTRHKLFDPETANMTDSDSPPSVTERTKYGSPKDKNAGPDGHQKTDSFRSDLIETQGPNIVSFSRVVSSGKRKHVLQFNLKPAVHGEELEVVKAHLWLLLTRHGSHKDHSEHAEVKVRKDMINVGKVKAKNETKSSEAKVDLNRSHGNYSEVDVAEVKVGGIVENETEVTIIEEREERRERQKRRSSSLHSPDEKHDHNRQKHRNDKHRDKNNADEQNQNNKHKEKYGNEEEDVDDEENSEAKEDTKFQAVLRVLLFADNGTRTLMTYLRTNVKVTHWQKIRLPVSVIQQQLQSSQSTLTLLIRCRRCGDAVRMVLPRKARSKTKRKKRLRRRKQKDGIHKHKSRSEKQSRNQRQKKNKKKKKRRRRRHGERRREIRKSVLAAAPTGKVQRLQFHPLPFLVINTRIRKSGKTLIA